MAWYIIANERKTWTKYLVKAEDEKEAIEGDRSEKQLGYLNGQNRDVALIEGPFESPEDALADKASYVEGR